MIHVQIYQFVLFVLSSTKFHSLYLSVSVFHFSYLSLTASEENLSRFPVRCSEVSFKSLRFTFLTIRQQYRKWLCHLDVQL